LALSISLVAAVAAQAQSGGGSGRGGKGGGHSKSAPATASTSSANVPPETPLEKIEIVGVIRAIDPAAGRITIEYEPVDALNWPKGTMPFVVSKTALLDGAAVGEKVRFKLQSQQISALAPF
jgi:Cu(I)/Ag(I) efflux system protein CusF